MSKPSKPTEPSPLENESKEQFIDRAIAELMKASGCSKEEASNAAYGLWAKSKNARSLYDELLDRFSKIRSYLSSTKLGKRGEVLLDYTLVRLGVFDPSMKKFNMAALDGNMNLPFFKSEDDGSITVGNLLAPPTEFTKIDRENKTVEGYANTVTIDTYADVFLPEAYSDSFLKEYGGSNPRKLYFMHHTDIEAGDILEMRFDSAGMYVKSRPFDNYWPLIESGKLKGYSIGFCFKIWPDIVGTAYITHKKFSVYGDDISYVTTPANLLSYFADVPDGDKAVAERTDKFVADKTAKLKTRVMPKSAIKADSPVSQSQKMTAPNGFTVGNKTQKGIKKLSQEQTKPKPDEEEQASEDKPKKSIYDMTPDEIIEYLKAEAKEEARKELIKKAEVIQENRKKADEDTFKKQALETFGKINASIDAINQKLETVSAKLAIHDEKMVKYESAPAETKAASTESASQTNLAVQAATRKHGIGAQ